MTDMIERVARVIHVQLEPWDAFGVDRVMWIKVARAAIAAMREPTDEMNDAGADKCDGGCAEESCQFGFMGKIWHAMIDAALEEKK